MKKNLLISFSGGETSAYMTKWLLENKQDEYNMVCVYANTGEETEETLEFVDKCDKEFNMNLVWVESKVHKEMGTGTTHRIVDFETAARNGEPFEEIISKFGIPNQAFSHCTRELKLRPIHSYIKRSLGWKKYWTAIGIRADEVDRVSADYKKNRLYYPLVKDRPMTKPKINFWWSQQPFRLDLKGYQGNCKTCWKKSFNKLMTISVENPEYFDTFKRLEKKYGNFIPEGRNLSKDQLPLNFFRGNKSTEDIFEMAKKPFKKSKDDHTIYDWQMSIFEFKGVDLEHLDTSNGCDESCEIY